MEQTTNPRFFSTTRFPHFAKPKVIGFFSVGSQRNYTDDCSQLTYLRRVPSGRVHFDLNHNAGKTIKRLEGEERLKNLLCHFRDHRESFDVFNSSQVSLADAPFVCYRGLLRELSALPYQTQEPLRFAAVLFRGVVYLHSLPTAESRARKAATTEREKIMCAWGYKFEQFMLSDDPNRDPDIEPPVDENSEFACVFQGRLNQHHLLYGAEMDGILVEGSSLRKGLRSETYSTAQVLQELERCQFVELKTSRRIEEKRHDITFRRHKTLSWWLQSFFAGVETIICGVRDDNGIVGELKQYKMFDLPKLNNNFWHPNVCMNFCDELLKYVKNCFAQEISRMPAGNVLNVRNLPVIELVFERLPRSSVQLVTPMPDEDISLLDDWFINMFPKA